jgi:hypothetical protein
LEEFQGLAWVPVQSKLLDYANAQILLVGHREEINQAKDVKSSEEQKKQEEVEEVEDLEQLAEEDLQRVHNLSGKKITGITVECRVAHSI